MRTYRRILVLAAIAVGAACGGGDGTGPSDPTPTNVVVNSGNNQQAVVATATAIAPAVQVRDRKGRGVPGISVTFTVASGGGSITGGVAISDAGGVARVGSWTLGNATGANTLTATVTGLTPATFTATAVAGAPAALVFTTAPGSTAQNGIAFPQQPVLQLRDQFGNNAGQAGVQVTAAILTGGGTLGGTVAVTSNASGVVTFTNLSITGTVGPRTLGFTATGLPVLNSGAVQLNAGAAATIAAASATTQSGTVGTAVGAAPSVTVTDVSGNPVAGATVTFAVTAGGGSVTGGTQVSNASGQATVGGWTLGTTAGQLNTVSATTGALVPVVFSATPAAGGASRLGITTQPGGTSAVNGAALAPQPVLQVQDALGNPVAHAVTVTATIASGGGTLGGTTAVATDGNGQAAFTDLSITGAAGARTLDFNASGLTGVTSAGFTLTAGPAATIAASGGDGQTGTVGAALGVAPSVLVTDASGNPVGGVAVTFAVASGGGSASGTAQTTGANGVATVGSWTLGTAAGSNSLTASAAGLSGSPVTFTATGTAGVASALALVTQPSSNATNGQALAQQPVVRITDAFGNPVGQAGATITATASAGGTVAAGATAVTNASGVATFSGLVLNGLAGNYTLGFAATGLTGATSGSIALGAGAPAQLSIVTQPSATAVNGVALGQQPVLQLTDVGGNPSAIAANVSASITGAPAGVTLGGTTTVSSSGAGVATFTNLAFTGVVGTYTLTFSSAGLSSAVSSSVGLVAGPATTIALNAGDGQVATVNQAVGVAPSVLVSDQSGNPVSGAAVTFAVATGGGNATGTSQVTNASGIATVGGWTLGPAAGSNTLTATSGSLAGSPVTFTATGTPAGATQLIVNTQPSGTATSGVALAQQPVVVVADQFGNPVTAAGVQVSVTVGAGASVTGGTATTNASGVATFSTLTLAGLVGNYTLTFNAAGLTAATSTPIALGAGAASQLAITTQPSGTAPNGGVLAQQPAVQVTDAFGNPVATATSVSAALTGAPAGVTLAGTTSVATNGSGLASFTDLGLQGVAGSYTLTFTGAGLGSVVSTTIVLGAGTATTIAVNAGDGQSATVGTAVATAPSVLVTDAFGNPVGGVAVTFGVASGGGSATGLTPTTGSNGIAAAGSWTLGTLAGSNTLTATSGSLGGSPVTFTATGTAAPASQLVFTTAPSGSATNATPLAQQPVVALADPFGNPVASAGVQVNVTIGAGAAVTGGSATTNGSGVATFTSLTVTGLAGSYTLSFGATGLTPATAGLTLSAGTATALSVTTQPSATATNPNAFAQQPVVQLRDVSGNAVTTAGVNILASLTGSPAGVSLGGTTTVATGAGGAASFTNLAPSGTAGNYTLTFSSAGLSSVVSSSFALVAGAPAAVTAASATSQNGRVGISAATLPTVTVVDVSGNPVSGATVTFQATAGGGSVSGASPTTDLLGQAAVGGWTFGRTVLTNTVTATVGALPAVSFDATVAFTLATTAGGDLHSCATTVDGVPYCWGDNFLGPVGDSSNTTRPAPVPVAGGLFLGGIAARQDFSCGLDAQGLAWCWGQNNIGQLGNGNTSNQNAPVAVSGGRSYSQITAGGGGSPNQAHACAIAAGGTLYCWGANGAGQYGNGGTTSASTPQVAGGVGATYTSVVAGRLYTCGVRTGGQAYCWGENSLGQLGDSTTIDRVNPVQVRGGLTFSQLAGGLAHTCGLTTGGLVYCWGLNASGRLGQDTLTVTESLVPVQVAGLTGVVELSGGEEFTCARTAGGQILCWGVNEAGQVGDGTLSNRQSPVAVALPVGVTAWSQVSAGTIHACATATTGDAYCWGTGSSGQLGDGNSADSALPVKIDNP